MGKIFDFSVRLCKHIKIRTVTMFLILNVLAWILASFTAYTLFLSIFGRWIRGNINVLLIIEGYAGIFPGFFGGIFYLFLKKI